MKTVYKYPLEIKDGKQTIVIPKDTQILHVDMQRGFINIWVEVHTEVSVAEERFFFVYGTGQPIPDDKDGIYYSHIGTVMDGIYVWHVYEKWAFDD